LFILKKIFYLCRLKSQYRVKKNDYTLEFSGLKPGMHDFSFDIGEDLFIDNGNEEVLKSNAKAKVVLDKRESFLELLITISGTITVNCDRCGGELEIPISNEEKIWVKFDQEDFEDSEEVIVLGSNEHKVDLSHPFFEFAFLSIPVSRVHPLDEDEEPTCDPEKLKELQLLLDGDTEIEGEQIDDRWSALKDLLTDKDL